MRDRPEEKILNEIVNGPACVYQQTKYEQSSLYLALTANKENVIKKLMEIYENDFKVLKEKGFDNDSGVLIAFKADEIAFVEEKLLRFSEKEKESDGKPENKVLILMKETNEGPAYVKSLSWKTEEEQKVYFKIIEKLYKNGTFDASFCTSSNNDNLFMVAASKGLIWVLEKLLLFGARHDAINKQNQNAFLFACINNHVETVKWFHKTFKIDLLKFMTAGYNLFHMVDNGSFETFDYILSKIKRFNGDEHIQGILSQKTEYCDNNVLMQAISRDKYEFAIKCLKYDFDLTVVDSSKSNILHLALRPWPGSRELFNIVYKQHPKLLLAEDSNMWTPLHLLATSNCIDEFKEIYKNFPSYKDSFFAESSTAEKTKDQTFSPTPGHYALNDVVRNNFHEMAEFILESHWESFVSSEYISELLNCHISSSDSIDFVKRLMKLKHFDINVPDPIKVYPLTFALQLGKLTTFKFLLNTCDITDLNAMTDAYSKANLLHSAVFNNPINIKHHPFPVCCFPHVADSSDDEAEKIEAPIPEWNPREASKDSTELLNERATKFEIFLDLLKRGIDVNNKDSFGKTLLHLAVEYDNIEVVQELLKLGLPTCEKDENGNVPLHYVKSVEVFNALMENETQPDLVNLKNEQQRTPFMSFVALFFQDDVPSELFDSFMKNNADVNTLGNEGYRPIHTALTKEWTAKLIENGADVNAKNHAGENILHLALRNFKFDIANYLLLHTDIDKFVETNEGVSYLGYLSVDSADFRQTFRGDLKNVFHDWIDKYIDGKNIRGGPIINDFITAGDLKVLNHPKADLHKIEAGRQTCLHHAINSNVKLEIVKFLVEKGLDVNAVDEIGQTPLLSAVDYNFSDKALFLIDQENIDLNHINSYGFTALHYVARHVARHKSMPVLCKLLSAGADPGILNNENETFYDLLSDFTKRLFASYAKKI